MKFESSYLIPSGINIFTKPDSEYILLSSILNYCNHFKCSDSKVTFFYGTPKYPNQVALIKDFNEKIEKLEYENFPLVLDKFWSRPINQIIESSKWLGESGQTRTSSRFVHGYGLLGTLNSLKQLNCIYCIVLKKSNVLSVINSILTNSIIDNSILEIWINSKLNQRGSDFFPKIKRNVLNYASSLGIIIKYKDKFPFFSSYELPTWRTLNDKKLWIKGIYNKMKTK